MAKLIPNFNLKDLSLISPQGNVSGSILNSGDYVRLTIFNSDTQNVAKMGAGGDAIFFSTLTTNDIILQRANSSVNRIIRYPDKVDFPIYVNANHNSLHLKPNEIMSSSLLSEGNYTLQVDFLNQVKPTANIGTPKYFSEFDIDGDGELDNRDADEWSRQGRPDISNIIKFGYQPPSFQLSSNFPQYFSEFDINGDGILNSDDVNRWSEVGRQDIADELQSIMQVGEMLPPQGNPIDTQLSEFYFIPSLPSKFFIDKFIVNEISPSRLEIRLKLRNSKITKDSNFISYFENILGRPYAYNHILNVGKGKNIQIVNYVFDKQNNGDNDQSIVLKLYTPVPNMITSKDFVTIEKEVLLTQVEPIYYFSDLGESNPAGGLIIDEVENWTNYQGLENYDFENMDDLSGSLSQQALNNIISGSSFDFPNLNTNFNEFENHTFFGSAKRKLENFKTKVSTVQSYYTEISTSLSSSGITMDGDQQYLISHRSNLFKKIEDDLKTLTSYEKFLYYDAQSETTASAPGIKDFTDSYAINSDCDFTSSVVNPTIFTQTKNGLPKVYLVTGSSTQNTSRIFGNKYRVENKPFFNNSGSFYLSFLVKADKYWDGDGTSNKFSHRFNNKIHNGYFTPEDSMHRNFITSASLTGSKYVRYIMEASSSHWQPTFESDFDAGSVSNFSLGSDQVQIISGSKTGSNIITTDNVYQNLATVVTQSGVPFSGSMLPTGDLFDVFLNSRISNLKGLWKFEKTGSLNESLEDTSGYENHGLHDGTDWITAVDGIDGFGIESKDNGGVMILPNDVVSASFQQSYAFWFKPSGITSEPSSLNGRLISRDLSEYFGVVEKGEWKENNLADLRVHHDAAQSTIISNALVSGSWHFNALTLDYTEGVKEFKYYLYKPDGTTETLTKTLIAASPSESIGSVANHPDSSSRGRRGVTIGCNSEFANEPHDQASNYSASFDDVRYYDKILNTDEVDRLYLFPNDSIRAEIYDVKVSNKNLSDVLPFDNVFSTASATWIDWYDGMYDSASTFDEENIHSLENNLPTYIQQSSEYDDLKQFLGLIGEQFDLIRNHIDGLGTFHNRDYNKFDSVPTNLMPTILDSMGWEAIQPFSSSLAEYFGHSLSSTTNINDITENTWRKTLNNLIYIYKTKGTENSVRALLNTYGYPPDVLKIQEFGGSEEESEGSGSNNPIDNKEVPIIGTVNVETDLSNNPGNVSFSSKKTKFYHYRMDETEDRTLKLDWWYNGARANTLQFVYKHVESTNTQSIIEHSGSASQTLWDLRLIPKNGGLSSSFEFRLNNSDKGSSNINTIANRISMSTDFVPIKNGQLWNVMLQRMSASISGSGKNEYRLITAKQGDTSETSDKILQFQFTSMSVNGAVDTDPDSQFYANQNWGYVTGSRVVGDNGNLYVGRTLSGSMSEIKAWSTPLSASKFRLHTLNKFSSVGNTLKSHHKELVYHYKLNENYNTSSLSSSAQNIIDIVDSGPRCFIVGEDFLTSYDVTMSADLATGSLLYGFTNIDINYINTIGLSGNSHNDNKIIINPNYKLTRNLTPYKSSIAELHDGVQQIPKRLLSNKLELKRSPQDFVDNFILDRIQGFDLESLYGNPQNKYSSSYSELDFFRDEFFDCFPIKVDVNKFIKGYENIFNNSLIEGLKSVAPARSTFSEKNNSAGILIRPTILEKQRIQYERHSLEVNPNLLSDNILILSRSNYQSGFSNVISLNLPIKGDINKRFKKQESVKFTPSLQATGSITVISDLPSAFDNKILQLTSTEGEQITYIFDDDSEGATGTTDGLSRTRIQLNGLTSKTQIAAEISKSIISANGHNGKLLAFDFEYLIDSNGNPILGEDGSPIALSSDGVVQIVQQKEDDEGNTDITTNVDESDMTIINFAGGKDIKRQIRILESNIINYEAETQLSKNGLVSINNSIITSSSLNLTKNGQISSLPALTSSVVFPVSGTIDYISTNNMAKFTDLHKNWGTGSTDVHFLNMAADGQSGSLNDYNVNHIDRRFVFHMIGDVETYSGSISLADENKKIEVTASLDVPTTIKVDDDFTNQSRFYNRKNISEFIHKNSTYESYMNGSPGLQNGRAMGKTRYFFTGSDGAIILPSNHVRKFDNPWVNTMYNGAQNVDPGILPFKSSAGEDYATASFYRVRVEGGDNQIIVRSPGGSGAGQLIINPREEQEPPPLN